LQVWGIIIKHADQTILQNLLRAIRKESGLSQQELATRLDKPQSFVSKYESGERRLDILEIFQICRTLRIPFAVFAQRLEDHLVEKNNAAQ
jgi:transcriptional regulator with XRE-family HTH domain